MRFLVVTQYFSPEPGAPSNRLQAFVDAMLERGHEVTVICEFPNYPSGRLAPADRWRLFRIEEHGSLKIVRTFVLTFARKNNIKRMLFYLSFAISSFIAALLLKRRDVILASSPPTFHVYMAMIVAKVKKSRIVVDIRDLLADAARETRTIRNRSLLRLGDSLERKLYRDSDLVFTISEGMKKRIETRGGKGKCRIVYNGSSDDILNWKGDIDSFRRSLGWHDKIVFAYAGIMGLPQNLKDLLPEIKEIHDGRILFAFIGEGQGREALEKEALMRSSGNICFFRQMPRSEVIPYVYSADVMMVILRELELFKSAIPSKFFDYMAAGKPIISNVNGELRNIMETNNTGLYFSLNRERSFGDAVGKLVENYQIRRLMGENGKRLVERSFLRKDLCVQAVKQIESLRGR
jgi:colanic acid biosynthesis glycosyl transferase WcaI